MIDLRSGRLPILLTLGILIKAGPTQTLQFPAEWALPVQSKNEILSMDVLPEGGFIAAGPYAVENGPSTAVFLARLDSEGRTQWLKTFGGQGDTVRQVQPVPGGGFLLVGDCQSKGAGRRDIWVLRTDATGNMEWEKTFGGDGLEKGYASLALPGGGFAVAGLTTSFRIDTSTMSVNGVRYYKDKGNTWFLLLDDRGDTLSTRLMGGIGFEAAYAMVAGPRNGFYLAGGSVPYAGYGAGWLKRLDSLGNSVWGIPLEFTRSRHGDAEAKSLFPAGDGGVYVAARDGYFVDELAIGKVGRDSKIAWSQILYGVKDGNPTAILGLPDGRLAIATEDSLTIADSLGGKESFATNGRRVLAMDMGRDSLLVLAGSKVSQGWIARPTYQNKPFPSGFLTTDTLSPESSEIGPTYASFPRKAILWKTEILNRNEGDAFRLAGEGPGPIFRIRVDSKYKDSQGARTHFWCFDSQGAAVADCPAADLPPNPEGQVAGLKIPPTFLLPFAVGTRGQGLGRYVLQGVDPSRAAFHVSRNGCLSVEGGETACVTNVGVTLGGNYDPVLTSLDGKGKPRWTRRYSTVGSEYGNSVHQTMDGGFLVTGSSTSFGTLPRSRILLLKTDSLGRTEWFRTISYADLASTEGLDLPNEISDPTVTINGKTYQVDVEGLQAIEIAPGEFLLLAGEILTKKMFLLRLTLPSVVPIDRRSAGGNPPPGVEIRIQNGFLTVGMRQPGPMVLVLEGMNGSRTEWSYAGSTGVQGRRMSVAAWAPGVYLATVKAGGNIWRKKLVILN